MTTRKQQLSREQINIKREVEYIVRRAAERDARVVMLGPLVFFSTETGDAWLLDPSDQLALCLARDGDPRPVNITESAETFAIGWDMTYQISGDRFIVAAPSGQSRTIIGYPMREIVRAIQRPQEFKHGDRPEVAQQIERVVNTGHDLLLGRNEPCWCGSGKKYKHCHMKADHGSERL
ncbi:MAG TPA: SEC-C domain-containing protein [Anaerolineae bacterium]|nr:SEC-C domain-containing protein [Anaerolineae bacterium]